MLIPYTDKEYGYAWGVWTPPDRKLGAQKAKVQKVDNIAETSKVSDMKASKMLLMLSMTKTVRLESSKVVVNVECW